jgi:hypothetical protein
VRGDPQSGIPVSLTAGQVRGERLDKPAKDEYGGSDMATVKKKIKAFWIHTWELFKAALPSMVMYFCAGLALMMLCIKEDATKWDGRAIAWVVVCNVVVAAYNFLMAFASGTTNYEMLVSGNLQRTSSEYKISTHKEAQEYRVWKGFAIGGFMAIFPIVFSILLGINQENIHTENAGGGMAWLTILSFFLSGWSSIPFFLMNTNGIVVSYFLSSLFALIPLAVSGGAYIAGAYAKRNKNLRERLIAEKIAEEEANKPKKINYGGLPGTKPKKKK